MKRKSHWFSIITSWAWSRKAPPSDDRVKVARTSRKMLSSSSSSTWFTALSTSISRAIGNREVTTYPVSTKRAITIKTPPSTTRDKRWRRQNCSPQRSHTSQRQENVNRERHPAQERPACTMARAMTAPSMSSLDAWKRISQSDTEKAHAVIISIHESSTSMQIRTSCVLFPVETRPRDVDVQPEILVSPHPIHSGSTSRLFHGCVELIIPTDERNFVLDPVSKGMMITGRVRESHQEKSRRSVWPCTRHPSRP